MGAASLSIALIVLLADVGAGCSVMKRAGDMPSEIVPAVTPGNKGKAVVDPVEMQGMLLRFADEFAGHLIIGANKLRRGTNGHDAAEILKWKIALGTETYSIVSRPNAVANLLDMTVFVTVTRMALEEYWQPKIFGVSAQLLLETCQNAETQIWQLAGTVLKPEQQTELRQALEVWYRLNPHPENILMATARDFAALASQVKKAETAKPASVFSVLKVDPFSGMEPAVREIAQTRLFAERALFITQKMPMLLRWQTELLSINAVEMPAVQQLITNSTQLATSLERFTGVTEGLPKLIRSERGEILEALQSQERNLTPLINEVRQTLASGTQMSASLNTTLATFDALMKRFGIGETNDTSLPKTNAEPFRIQDYTQTAAQLETTARQLTELLVTLDRTIGSTNLAQLSAQVDPVVQRSQAGGKEIADYAFRKALLFLIIACVTVLLTVLVYRFLGTRFVPANRRETNLP